MASNVYGQQYGFTSTTVTTGAGVTLGVFVDPPAQTVNTTVKVTAIGSGATLKLVGTGAPGTTLAPADLNTAFAAGYPLAANETLPFTGPSRFYLASAAAACTIEILYGLSMEKRVNTGN